MPTLAERRAAFAANLAKDSGGNAPGGVFHPPVPQPRLVTKSRDRRVSEIRQENASAGMDELENSLIEWIGAVLGEPLAAGHLSDILRSGVVLCNLLNAIRPGTVRRISTSRLPFPQRENIKAFTDNVRGFGVPDHENFGTDDLFEQRNIKQVLLCLASLGRHTHDLTDYTGPTYGKAQVKARATGHQAAKTVTLWGKSGAEFGTNRSAGRDVQGEQQRARQVSLTKKYVAKSTRNDAHSGLKGIDETLTPSNAHQVTYPGSDSDQALAWLDEVTGENTLAEAAAAGGGDEGFAVALDTGEVLCGLVNTLVPGTIPHIARVAHGHVHGAALSSRVNIQAFVDGARQLGVKQRDTFEPNDLYERRHLPAVSRCILALGRAAWEIPGYCGPCPVKRDLSAHGAAARGGGEAPEKKWTVKSEALWGSEAAADANRIRLAESKAAAALEREEGWRPVFTAFDLNGDGEIQTTELQHVLMAEGEGDFPPQVVATVLARTSIAGGNANNSGNNDASNSAVGTPRSAAIDFASFVSAHGVGSLHHVSAQGENLQTVGAAAQRFGMLAHKIEAEMAAREASQARRREMDSYHAEKQQIAAQQQQNESDFGSNNHDKALAMVMAGVGTDPGQGARPLGMPLGGKGGLGGLGAAIAGRRKRAGTTTSGMGTGEPDVLATAAAAAAAVTAQRDNQRTSLSNSDNDQRPYHPVAGNNNHDAPGCHAGERLRLLPPGLLVTARHAAAPLLPTDLHVHDNPTATRAKHTARQRPTRRHGGGGGHKKPAQKTKKEKEPSIRTEEVARVQPTAVPVVPAARSGGGAGAEAGRHRSAFDRWDTHHTGMIDMEELEAAAHLSHQVRIKHATESSSLLSVGYDIHPSVYDLWGTNRQLIISMHD